MGISKSCTFSLYISIIETMTSYSFDLSSLAAIRLKIYSHEIGTIP